MSNEYEAEKIVARKSKCQDIIDIGHADGLVTAECTSLSVDWNSRRLNVRQTTSLSPLERL